MKLIVNIFLVIYAFSLIVIWAKISKDIGAFREKYKYNNQSGYFLNFLLLKERLREKEKDEYNQIYKKVKLYFIISSLVFVVFISMVMSINSFFK